MQETRQQLVGRRDHTASRAPPPNLPGRAAKASRLNTYLSVPLLFFMGAGSEGHYPIFNYPTLIVVLVAGFLIVKGLYGLSTKVKGV